MVRWHRTGFRLYWRWLSRNQKVFGRKRISKELRDLIFRSKTARGTVRCDVLQEEPVKRWCAPPVVTMLS